MWIDHIWFILFNIPHVQCSFRSRVNSICHPPCFPDTSTFLLRSLSCRIVSDFDCLTLTKGQLIILLISVSAIYPIIRKILRFTYVSCGGDYSHFKCIANSVAWVASNVEGSYKRAVTLGMAIGFGNINGAITANIVRTYSSIEGCAVERRLTVILVSCERPTAIQAGARYRFCLYCNRVDVFDSIRYSPQTRK